MVKQWGRMANRTQGWWAVGGRLTVRDHDLVFEPNGFDALFGGQWWRTPLSAITGLRRAPRDLALGNLLTGSLVDRLEITLSDRTVEQFRTSDIDGAVAELTALRDASRAAASPEAT